jgi:sterol desaturase/sphingolipid hydroxylase (fatty acid hydroxylase superfamily)
MAQYGQILLMAMPVFLLLVLFEKWYGWRKGFETVRSMDMISSLTSGITNVTKDVLGLSFAIISYQWLLDRIAVTTVQSTFLTYIIAFVALDFAGYVVHTLNHKVNFFWNAHIVHHSSEEYNLACALRQSVSVFVKLFVILLLPAALLGVPASVIAVVAPLHLFAQFWYHTRHIGKMGFLEHIIVTPSHHRVHHAMNPEYMDKNFGQIFIIWDKLFGTFQKELKDVPAVFGVTRPVRTWNPIKINFQHLWLLMQDAWRTASWKDKFRIWLMPTGWRPADVEAKYPVYKIEDVYDFEKYNTVYSKPFLVWTWIQVLMLLLFVSYLFGNIASIGMPQIFVYGGFLFVFVYAFTELMDGHQYAFVWETLKTTLGIGILFYYGDWFGLNNTFNASSFIVLGYLLLSLGMSIWFSKNQLGFSSKKLAVG